MEKQDGRKTSSQWAKYSDLEILTKLREEIERIGIQDRPSRTEFQKLYDNKKIMSPNALRYRFGKPWEEIMQMIGLEYNTKKISQEKGKKLGKSNQGKKNNTYKNSKWNNLSEQEFKEIVIKSIEDKDIKNFTQYNKLRDKENAPSVYQLKKKISDKVNDPEVKWDHILSYLYGKGD